MKTYNNLFEKYVSAENIALSIQTAKRGDKSKRTKERLTDMQMHMDVWLPKFRKIATNFYNHKHSPKEIYDGITRKKRTIIVPTVIELVVQHMMVNVLKHIFMQGLYEHTYAAIPGRGAHLGKKWLEQMIQGDFKNTKYCLKVDVHHFFDSVDKDILKKLLAHKISDEKFLQCLYTVIDVVPRGLPLGFYTSQWYANWYLIEFDHFVKEKLSIKYYARYMDDMVFLGGNKRKLHKVKEEISHYLKEKLKLKLKDSVQFIRIGTDKSNFIDFMGFRFYRNRTILRRSIMLKCTRRAKRLKQKLNDGPLTVFDARQMLSYKGWLADSNTYSMYLRYVKPNISFKALRKIVSRYDKRRNEKCGTKQKVV